MTDPQQRPSLWQVILSVLAAMFGVQSGKARERDFTHGNPWVFIVVGIIAVMVFVAVLYGVVHGILLHAKA